MPLVVDCWPQGGRYVEARVQVTAATGASAVVELRTVRLRDGLELDRPGELPGIGASLDLQPLRHRVLAVEPGGPAAEAGLRPGDVIVAVGDVKTDPLAPAGVAALIGDQSPVQLTILRGAETVRLTVHPEQ